MKKSSNKTGQNAKKEEAESAVNIGEVTRRGKH